MSPVHKSTREGREGRERERERAAFAKFGKADIPVEVGKKNYGEGFGDDEGMNFNRFQ